LLHRPDIRAVDGEKNVVMDLQVMRPRVLWRRDERNRFRLKRVAHVYNSSGRQLPSLARHGGANPAFVHPADADALGVEAGDLVDISSARATIPAVVALAEDVLPGTVSMAHSFGDKPEFDHKVREIGSSTNRLLWNDRVFERYSGQPLMSNVPVNVRPIH